MTNPPDQNPHDPTQHVQPGVPVPQGFTPQHDQDPTAFGATGAPSGQFAAPPSGQFPIQPQPGVFPPPAGYWQAAPQPGALARLGAPNVLALLSAVAGLITFCMGFVAWVTIDQSLEHKAENWADGQGDKVGIPGFFSVNMVLNPGYFFLILGVCGVAAALVVVPAYRRFLPLVAVFTALGYLGLFASAVVLPEFLTLGPGAIVALIFGAAQLALVLIAAVVAGMRAGS